MAEDLEGLDLTPLVVPNLRHWSAMRASAAFYSDVVASPPSVMIEGAVGGVEFDPYRWHLDARMLSLVVGNWRIHVTPEGRRLRGRPHGSAPAQWDAIAWKAPAFHLVGVLLNGIQRRVRVSSERDIDVYQDVRTIRESIKDQFQIPEVTIRYDAQEVAGEILVDFTRMLAVADVAVPLAELAAIAVELLTQGNPLDEALIDRSVLPQMPGGI